MATPAGAPRSRRAAGWSGGGTVRLHDAIELPDTVALLLEEAAAKQIADLVFGDEEAGESQG